MLKSVVEELARGGALLRVAQAEEAAPRPPHGTPHWVAYGVGKGILLAIVLLAIAGGFACAGKRLRAPLAVARPGRVAAGFMIAIWLLAIYDVVVATMRQTGADTHSK